MISYKGKQYRTMPEIESGSCTGCAFINDDVCYADEEKINGIIPDHTSCTINNFVYVKSNLLENLKAL